MRALVLLLVVSLGACRYAGVPGGGGDPRPERNTFEDGDGPDDGGEGEGEGEDTLDLLCVVIQECAGEDDPEARCEEQKADMSDEDRACLEVCRGPATTFAACALETGRCEDGVFDFGSECQSQLDDYADCFGDC